MNDDTTLTKYRIFTRTWWKSNPSWPDGREPHMGHKHTLTYVYGWYAAVQYCKEYNRTHKPGFLSRKAEFEEA